jgi:ATP phosphoribosyltransferase
VVRIALPDGHLQGAAARALAARGLTFAGYDQRGSVRRPPSPIAGLEAKVIRPHDMPQLVALGSFDLAISGRDCLRDHLYRFPSSPVEEVADLETGGFDLCAVVSRNLPADSLDEALAYWRSQGRTVLRLASEFVNIADHYARSHHLWRYRVIPTAGASEGFVPDDADLLIEGTETGETLARNDLKAIDLLFRSTTCLLAGKNGRPGGRKAEVYQRVVSALSGRLK